MDYVKDHLLPALKHENRMQELNNYALKLGLWYTTSHNSYVQRTAAFEKSFLMDGKMNPYVGLILADVLNIPQVVVFEKTDICNQTVRAYPSEQVKEPCLFFAPNSPNYLFTNFWDKVRNAFAHGTFNHHDGWWYVLGQESAKPDAKVNFLLQTTVDYDSALLKLWSMFSAADSNPSEFKYHSLRKALRLVDDHGKWYSERFRRSIVIDESFRRTTKKSWNKEIAEYIRQFKTDEPMDILINATLKDEKDGRIRTFDHIRVIGQDSLIDAYQLNTVLDLRSSAQKQ